MGILLFVVRAITGFPGLLCDSFMCISQQMETLIPLPLLALIPGYPGSLRGEHDSLKKNEIIP